MFLQASVILLTGGRGYLTPPGSRPPRSRHPPQSRPPQSRHSLAMEADTPCSRHPPEQTPPQSRHPPPPEQTPRSRNPPTPRVCCEIRSTRGRYASYWNAILLQTFFIETVYKTVMSFLTDALGFLNRIPLFRYFVFRKVKHKIVQCNGF